MGDLLTLAQARSLLEELGELDGDGEGALGLGLSGLVEGAAELVDELGQGAGLGEVAAEAHEPALAPVLGPVGCLAGPVAVVDGGAAGAGLEGAPDVVVARLAGGVGAAGGEDAVELLGGDGLAHGDDGAGGLEGVDGLEERGGAELLAELAEAGGELRGSQCVGDGTAWKAKMAARERPGGTRGGRARAGRRR